VGVLVQPALSMTAHKAEAMANMGDAMIREWIMGDSFG
jgi:hypothetical protein